MAVRVVLYIQFSHPSHLILAFRRVTEEQPVCGKYAKN
jgi:hypothetical protein